MAVVSKMIEPLSDSEMESLQKGAMTIRVRHDGRFAVSVRNEPRRVGVGRTPGQAIDDLN